MVDPMQQFGTAAVFGASGGIGAALVRALAAADFQRVYAGSRSGVVPEGEAIVPFRFDYDDPASLSAAAETMAGHPPELVIVATGVLSLPDGPGPERSYKQLEAATMERVLRLNTIGPALVARHLLPLFPRDRRCVFAALSARVGSIGDNRIGGWHSYRASKAALNMLMKNFAIELARTHKQAVAVSLHPGTVDTALSEPFQANLPDGQLTQADTAARNLLTVIEKLTPACSGHQFDWRGERIPD
ncbi:SDR family NAD(P)-dependent oxidoreductase [Erythrobacter sp. SDW2]|uniref:SDR family NAD(P)-dependent oxidoreductase n=1 Tax=Erythrobacter sp. SDW2 TaxID=2907154 RepID=UPI001F381111|nr:SDR family NAD(P)-dependent oxidoreductase [Erythrobacter sp. SDW2]UIP05658.1 SDR family NAD(P)-dependent oxidoreductase [Erythrobacter sp. SDW2]